VNPSIEKDFCIWVDSPAPRFLLAKFLSPRPDLSLHKLFVQNLGVRHSISYWFSKIS